MTLSHKDCIAGAAIRSDIIFEAPIDLPLLSESVQISKTHCIEMFNVSISGAAGVWRIRKARPVCVGL